ncbi:MAG: type 4a pilus biogenesis protein PilO [Candidatus Omnitrophota bacterium]
MMLSSLSKREKTLFYIILTLIIVWIATVFIVKPFVDKWMKIEEKMYLTSLRVEKNRKILSFKERIQSEYDNFASAVKMQGSEEEEMAKFLTEIESLAQVSSVHISDIKPRPVKKTVFYDEYIIEVEVEGDIAQISKFIYDIQNSPRLLKIDKFSLGTKGAASALLKCDILVGRILIP